MSSLTQGFAKNILLKKLNNYGQLESENPCVGGSIPPLATKIQNPSQRCLGFFVLADHKRIRV